MKPPRKSAIRSAVLGADRAFQVLEGGKDAPPPKPRGDDDDNCPVRALGYNHGGYCFLNGDGLDIIEMPAHKLCSRAGILGLFLADEDWLRNRFPKKKLVDDGNGGKSEITVDFGFNAAAAHLIRQCRARGYWGNRMTLRGPGIWRADDGQPVVHAGDAVLIDGEWRALGLQDGRRFWRTANQVWTFGEAAPRPDTPCDAGVAAKLQQDMQLCWRFKQSAGAIAVLGMLYSGYLCGALEWRINTFITGGTGSGKSALRTVCRALWPMHIYSNDTTKPGIEQAISGAIPTVLDETNDRNKNAGRDLINMVLGAGGDEGTQGLRGTADGRGRAAQVISAVMMFSIDAPELQPQHLNRFLCLELLPPLDGADFRAEHAWLAGEARKYAASLWGRAISSFERYQECLRLFRVALRERDCSPREMDSKGALLAGWYVLTHEGLPGDLQLSEGVAALGELVVSAEQARLDDGPRRALRHLLGFLATLHRSTDRDPIGVLLDRSYGDDPTRDPGSAWDTLGNYGIRPIRACRVPDDKVDLTKPCTCAACEDPRTHKPVPRIGRGDGLWIANSNDQLTRLFAGTDWDAGRWRQQLLRLPSARGSKRSVRVGGNSGYAIWLARADLHVDVWEDDPNPRRGPIAEEP